MVEPLKGITAENYSELGKAFIGAHGHGFVIIRDKAWATHDYPHTPREWGAWMAYFKSRRIPTLVFDQKGKGTVPARWPHEFDATWREEVDERSADVYEADVAQETQSLAVALDVGARKTFISNKLGYDPSRTRGVARHADEPEKPPQFIDRDLLLECHDKDMAELKAKRAARA